MSFPTSPTNGQTATLNGITYTYSSANTSWTRVSQSVTSTISLTVLSTSQSTSTTTGALQVVGGVGIGGNIYFNGNLYQNGVLFTSGSTSTTSTFNITNITQSTSTTTGALVVAGGVGVGGNIYSAGIHVIQNSTNASSTTTGALIVQGGVGIAGNAYVGGNLYTNGSIILPTSIQEFTATGGQTLFTVAGGYTVGTIQIFANGVQLASSDYTASNGTTVSLNTPRVSGDIIRTVSGLTSSSINNINALAIAYSVAFGG